MQLARRSDGYWHDRITMVMSPFVALTCALVALRMGVHPLPAAALGLAGCLAGLLINPDLDQQGMSHAETNWRGFLGPVGHVLSGAWVLLWSLYAWAIPHRSPLSHWPLLGTAGRVLYLAAAYTIVQWALRGWRIYLPPVILLPTLVVGFTVGGLAAADVGHWVRDTFTRGR